MKQIVAGIVAHVDAGKTTLSEALLYRTGEIRKLGRVDHGDAFLDTNSLEKARGITIFAHQALVEHGDLRLTLLDTRGTWTSQPKPNGCCVCLITRFLWSPARMACKAIPRHCGVCWPDTVCRRSSSSTSATPPDSTARPFWHSCANA